MRGRTPANAVRIIALAVSQCAAGCAMRKEARTDLLDCEKSCSGLGGY